MKLPFWYMNLYYIAVNVGAATIYINTNHNYDGIIIIWLAYVCCYCMRLALAFVNNITGVPSGLIISVQSFKAQSFWHFLYFVNVKNKFMRFCELVILKDLSRR